MSEEITASGMKDTTNYDELIRRALDAEYAARNWVSRSYPYPGTD